MDATAINAIADLAINNRANTDLTINAVLVPKTADIKSLEPFQSTPDVYRAQFTTAVLSEFAGYLNLHADENSGIFIDQANMTASAIIDLGHPDDPQWGKHRAALKLKNSPAFQALIEHKDLTLDQQTLIDFIEDWKNQILFSDGQSGVFDTAQTIRTLRRLKVSANATKEQTIGSFAASASALESIEIKAGNDELPHGFFFKTEPHEGFKTVEFYCELRALSDEKSVKLKFRVMQWQTLLDSIADEFKSKLTNIPEIHAAIHIGTIQYQ